MEEEWMSGNKGEWSEVYALLKILGDGVIFGADGNMKRNPKVQLDVSRVIRHDDDKEIVFVRIPERELVQVLVNGEEYANVPVSDIVNQYRSLFIAIRNGKKSFSVPSTEKFLRGMGCTSIKAPSNDKTDITLVVRDRMSGGDLMQGFSIKSMLGSPSTLVNASGSTNFIYILEGGMTQDIADKANGCRESSSKTKIVDMLTYLKSRGITLRFSDTESRTLFNNLTLLDTSMPELVGEMLKLYYEEGVSRILDQVDLLNRRNPLGFSNVSTVPYYEYKIKRLLVSYALGMQSARIWNGLEDANGGYIVVRDDGDVLCYHILDRGNFEDYLIRNTRFDTPSISKHGYAYVYLENGEFKMKLNMQIRFI